MSATGKRSIGRFVEEFIAGGGFFDMIALT
jgi:hypothetical protein